MGKRKVKDANAPKKNISAFFWFCNEERPAIKARNPEFRIGDVAKELGRMWGQVTPEVKAKFQAIADKDKARYEKEMEAYEQGVQPSSKKARA